MVAMNVRKPLWVLSVGMFGSNFWLWVKKRDLKGVVSFTGTLIILICNWWAINTFKLTLKNILDFLHALFKQDLGYSSVNSAISALLQHQSWTDWTASPCKELSQRCF